LVIYNVDS